MNSSAYDANVVHHEHSAVQHQTPSGHPAHRPNIVPALSSFYHPHASSIPISAQQQTAQLQLTTINTGGNNRSQVTSNSPPGAAQAAALFDPRQVHLATALEKTFFNTSTAGIQTSGQRFYRGVPSTVAASGGTNPVNQITQQQHHHHQQGNTILITNNFSAHQYGAATPQVAEVSAQMQPRATTGVVGGVAPAVTSATGSYNNGNAGNIRIITTLPSTLHHQQQQHIYNIAKEVEATVRDDIIQLPQFYHTPHQQSSAYTQHLPTILPTHYTQQQFVATTTAPTSLQISQDDTQQQHQFFMSMTNDGEGAAASSATLTAVPKLMPTLTGEATIGTDAVTTSPTIITSPAAPTNSNSTLVLDRINICINNHYSDSLAANNGLSTTTLDSNATTTTAAITPVAHTFPMATHAPQQPSPIIPAIHHKVLLDSVGGGGGNGGLHTDSYASTDSTLVIDEPDSTTTTPHTPPTVTENNSPPPRTLNLSSARTVPPQSITTQNVNVDTFVGGKENYIVSPTTVCIPTIKALVNKEPDKATTYPSGHTFTTITQSIDLIDDDESDYANSDVDNATETEGVENTENAVDNIIVEIEGNEVDLSTPAKMCLKNNTKSDRTVSPSLISKAHGIGGLHDSSRETDMKELKLDYPQAPIPVKILQTAADGTASSVALINPSIPTTSLPCLQDSLRVEKKVTNAPLPSPEICFPMGEDVFIRKDDGRQYLGTVIGSSAGGGINQQQKMQYLVRFDDNSELWCSTEEMRRLGGSGGIGYTQMCVACKRTQVQDVVEICDDCRRGYHRNCTRETTPGSGVWWCLRKPMKDQPHCTSKTVCKSHLHHNRCYKNSCDASKSLPSSQKIKTPADVYEFHIEDNEIFTSDDEIPIKHIMEKVRKSRDSAQNSNATSMRPKPIKKLSNSEDMLCEKIVALDDENANDVNSVGNIPEAPQKEKVNDKDGLSGIPSQSTNCITSLKQGTEESEVDGKIIDSIHGPKTVSSVYNKVPSVAIERSSRKRKAFTLSNSYKEVAAEAASKRYDSSRICDSSSDENSSSSRGTSLDVIIPPPKNFLGLNNPFRMVTPKKNFSASYVGGASAGCMQSLLNFNYGGTMIKSSIFNTTALDFSSKLAALKSAGIFPNLSTSNLAKSAGQPRTVRTIKRRLSAKDITIGPNQEVRRRRTRRLSSNIEIISTTTINPIPSNFFPIHAKDLFSTHTHHTTTTTTSRNMSSHKQQHQQSQQQATSAASASISSISSSSSASSSPPGSITSSVDSQVEVLPSIKPSHGRRLRQRPQKNSPVNSRRSSVSSASTASSTNSSSNITLATLQQQQQSLHTNSNKNTSSMSASATSMHDLKQSVKAYFGGALNRIESGEHFCIRAKRQLANGQMQYLIEWGDVVALPQQGPTTHTSITCPTSTTVTLKNDH